MTKPTPVFKQLADSASTQRHEANETVDKLSESKPFSGQEEDVAAVQNSNLKPPSTQDKNTIKRKSTQLQ